MEHPVCIQVHSGHDIPQRLIETMECVGQRQLWYRSTPYQCLRNYLAHYVLLDHVLHTVLMPAYPRNRFTNAAPFSFE